jgi:ParB family transcriptional regulator, chromosome partitioning protein
MKLTLTQLKVPHNALREAQTETLEFDELCASIASRGVLCPLLVRPDGDDYYLIVDGCQRAAAAKRVGLSEVPVIVIEPRDDNDALEISIIANTVRVAQDPMQVAIAFRRIMTFNPDMTLAELGKRVGKDPYWCARVLNLTTLDSRVAKRVESGEIGLNLAVALAQLPIEVQFEMASYTGTERTCDLIRRIDSIRRTLKTPWKKKAWNSQPRTRVRAVTQIKEEIANPTHMEKVLSESPHGLTPGNVWVSALQWALQIDPYSLRIFREKVNLTLLKNATTKNRTGKR